MAGVTMSEKIIATEDFSVVPVKKIPTHVDGVVELRWCRRVPTATAVDVPA